MSEQTALQDLLALRRERSRLLGGHGRLVGGKDEEIDRFLIEALAASTSAGPDDPRRARRQGGGAQEEGEGALREENGREFSGFLPAAAKPLEIPEDRAGQVAMGEQFGGKDPRVQPDIAAVRQEILNSPEEGRRLEGQRDGCGLHRRRAGAGEPAQRQDGKGRVRRVAQEARGLREVSNHRYRAPAPGNAAPR